MKHPVPEPDQIKYYKHHVLLERFKDYIKEICIHDKVNNNALLKLCNVCNIFSLDVVWIPSIFKNLNIIGVIFRKQVFKRYVKFLTMIFWYIIMILASCCNTRISNYNICFSDQCLVCVVFNCNKWSGCGNPSHNFSFIQNVFEI